MSGRVTFETDEDRAREAEVANRFAERWGCTLHKNPKYYPIDWVEVANGKLISWLEIKCRDIAPTQYPTVILGVLKYAELMAAHSLTGLPARFAALFNDDRVRYIDVAKIPLPLVFYWGGRSRRYRDMQDFEPEIHIKITDMMELT